MKKTISTEQDAVLKEHFGNPEYLADFINGSLFAGIQILDPKYMEYVANDESGVFEIGDKIESRNAYRDTLALLDSPKYKILVGLEYQSYYLRAVSLKCLKYATMNYIRQEKLWKNGPLKKLIPVITPIFYVGEKRWLSNHNLNDITIDVPKNYQEYINNWKTKVIDVKNLDPSLFRVRENRELIEGIQRVYRLDKDPNALEGFVTTVETVIKILTVTNSEEILKYVEKEKEEVYMCKALDNVLEKSRKEGRKEGEQNKAKSIAMNMLNLNKYSLEEISFISGLSVNEVKALAL